MDFVSIENKAKKMLAKFPKTRIFFKGIYHRLSYVLSKEKIKSEGNLIRISPEDEYEYFFGYYDKSPWDITDRYMISLRVKNAHKVPDSTEKAEIVVFDTQDNNKIEIIGTTHCWNTQQGCAAQWLVPDYQYEDGTLKEKMFAQIGTSTYKPKYYEYKDFISSEEFDEYINKANIVVSHGSSGSIMKVLNADKKVIAVTRLEKYGEHINDHQIQNNEAFSSNNYVLMADLELNNLGERFKKIKSKNNGLVKWENKDPMAIVNMIDEFIMENW